MKHKHVKSIAEFIAEKKELADLSKIKKGALHKQLGYPEGEVIPVKELNKIIKAELDSTVKINGKEHKVTELLKKRANFAVNFGHSVNEGFGLNNSKIEDLVKALKKLELPVKSIGDTLSGNVFGTKLKGTGHIFDIKVSKPGYEILDVNSDAKYPKNVVKEFSNKELNMLLKYVEKTYGNGRQVKENFESINDIADISFDDKNVTYIKNDFEITGVMRKYNSGRSDEYEFEPDSFDGETEEYFDRNWEDISAEIVDAYNDELGKRFGRNVSESFGKEDELSEELKSELKKLDLPIRKISSNTQNDVFGTKIGSIEPLFSIRVHSNGYEVIDVDSDARYPKNVLKEFKTTELKGLLGYIKKNYGKVDEKFGPVFKHKKADDDDKKDDDNDDSKSRRRCVEVTFTNGDSLTTEINGTVDEIKKYYIGKTFNMGHNGDDLMTKGKSVKFLK